MEDNNKATVHFLDQKLSPTEEITKAISEAAYQISDRVASEGKELSRRQIDLQDEILILKGRINHLLIMVSTLLILVIFKL